MFGLLPAFKLIGKQSRMLTVSDWKDFIELRNTFFTATRHCGDPKKRNFLGVKPPGSCPDQSPADLILFVGLSVIFTIKATLLLGNSIFRGHYLV
ncbi:MAG: hypothetical protein CMI18_06035 [Opitutaceae bacterium]|nr:hypothetical protein [Opitutaceae bacterium]